MIVWKKSMENKIYFLMQVEKYTSCSSWNFQIRFKGDVVNSLSKDKHYIQVHDRL